MNCSADGIFEGDRIIPVKNPAAVGEWHQYSIEFNSGSNDKVRLNYVNYSAETVSYLDDFQLTEIIPEHQVSLTKATDDFVVSIDGWQAAYQYQIWTWQEVASDTFGTMNQWVLSMSYTLGSALTDAGDGTKTVNLGTVFDSPDPYYTVAVKIIDGDGNFAGQLKDTYTPEEIGEVIIEKVDVDGAFVGENAIVKDIDGGLVAIDVYTNITDGVTYAAVVSPGMTSLTSSGASFDWDVSALAPGMYSVKLTAQNGASSDERTIKFNLYQVDETINYGRMDSIGVTGTPDSGAGAFRINIAPTAPQGEWVTYSISEPWRSAIYSSSAIARATAVDDGITDVNIGENSYGVYQVATYIKRSLSGSTDDGMIRTVENSRSGTKTLDVNVNGSPYAGTVSSQTAQQITITPNAVISEIGAEDDILYSYWRRDARGWVLIRDYNTTAQLTWTPARVGLYSIQVRVKGSDAGSYEMSKNLEFNITADGFPLLTVDSITLSGTDTVNARTPVTITANAVNPSSEDVLYKYIISNGFIYYVETAYTADPTYVWTPGKAGNYSVSVLVKNEASFGKYDTIESFTVDVN